MAQDLITRARALSNLNNLSTTANENTTLDQLIRAVSQAIGRWCRRDFSLQSHDELYDGDGGARLLLRHYPIVAVNRVATAAEAVLAVANTSAANQRATVQVTDTGLTLVRVASGTTTTDTSVTWAANVTLGAVAAAVNALGNGWSATAAANHGSRASSDLRPVQGALNARGRPAELLLHTEELGDYEVDAVRGMLIRAGGWTEGTANYRVVYSAGYATVPEDVQQACAEWVAYLFWMTKKDAGQPPQSLYTHDLPPTIKRVLAAYRKHA